MESTNILNNNCIITYNYEINEENVFYLELLFIYHFRSMNYYVI